jgi:hypothetical protein
MVNHVTKEVINARKYFCKVPVNFVQFLKTLIFSTDFI